MSSPIVTGANIFRAKQVLTAAQIRALNTTPVLIVPAVPGKVIFGLAALSVYRFGTQPYNFGSGATASLFFGNGAVFPAFGASTDVIQNVLTGGSVSQSGLLPPAGEWGATFAQSEGLGIYLIETAAEFAAGGAATAIVDSGHAGLLYAPGDTGTLSGAGDGTATYTVLTAGAGGAVETLSVAGGNGYAVGTGITTTVTTGIGDGTLEVNITAVRVTGDGTIEIDVLYQPI